VFVSLLAVSGCGGGGGIVCDLSKPRFDTCGNITDGC
jgi:hypothetical protein